MMIAHVAESCSHLTCVHSTIEDPLLARFGCCQSFHWFDSKHMFDETAFLFFFETLNRRAEILTSQTITHILQRRTRTIETRPYRKMTQDDA